MKEENERRIVAEKQVAEIDDKIVQCKSNISVPNDLIDLVQVNIKQAVEEKNTQKSKQLTQQGLNELQLGTGKKRKFEEDLKKLQKEKNDCLAKKNKWLQFLVNSELYCELWTVFIMLKLNMIIYSFIRDYTWL